MMVRFRTNRARFVAAALYALAMVLVGFAHRQPASPDAATVARLFGLPGIDATSICITDSGDVGRGGPAPCDACRLTQAPGLGAVSPPVLAQPATVLASPAIAGSTAVAAAAVPCPSARGPPAATLRA